MQDCFVNSKKDVRATPVQLEALLSSQPGHKVTPPYKTESLSYQLAVRALTIGTAWQRSSINRR